MYHWKKLTAGATWWLACITLVGAGGCMHNRAVTPWLRTQRSVPFRLFAESGGHSRPDKVKVERREGGTWVELDEDDDLALAFAGGTRAVVGHRLYRESGPPVTLPCDGELRATPDGAELVCVEIFGRFSRNGPPQTIRVARFDRDGAVAGRRDVRFPVEVPKDEPALGQDVTNSFLGFLPDGLVFSVLLVAPRESFANDTRKQLRAFLLRADDTWSELGTLDVGVGELWKLHFSRPWREALGLPISDGERLHDSRGEPNP